MEYELDLIEFGGYEYVAKALQDDGLRHLARGPSYPIVDEDKIKKEIQDSPGAWWMIIIDDNKRGWCRVTPIDRWEANLGIVIADPAYRQKGLGFDVCRMLLTQFVFPVFRKCSWITWDYNDSSIALAKKLGFRLEARTDPTNTLDYTGSKLTDNILHDKAVELRFVKGRLNDGFNG